MNEDAAPHNEHAFVAQGRQMLCEFVVELGGLRFVAFALLTKNTKCVSASLPCPADRPCLQPRPSTVVVDQRREGASRAVWQ